MTHTCPHCTVTTSIWATMARHLKATHAPKADPHATHAPKADPHENYRHHDPARMLRESHQARIAANQQGAAS